MQQYEACLSYSQSSVRDAAAELRAYQIHSVGREALGEDLGPGVRLDVRELELGVVGVHRVDVLPRWRAQHLHHSAASAPV